MALSVLSERVKRRLDPNILEVSLSDKVVAEGDGGHKNSVSISDSP